MASLGTMAAQRFGYGLRPGETQVRNVDDLIDQVRRGTQEVCPFPYDGIEGRRASFPEFQALQKQQLQARKAGTVKKIDGRPVDPSQVALTSAFLRDQHLKVQHAVSSPNSFFERLAFFWCDHFSVSASKVGPMRVLVALYEAEAIRPNISASFEQLLKAAALHPAMLIYLDQTKSVGPNSPAGRKRGRGLNENLARELIELHTMGAGSGYTQDDVRAAAYVLTGLDTRPWVYQTNYRPNWAEPGVHEVLGRQYGGRRRSLEDVTALLSDLAGREETCRHICRKLVVHFISDDPPQEVVDAMVTAWVATDGNLTEVYRALLNHPRSWEQEGEKARQPFDYVVAGLRAFDVPVKFLGPLPTKDGRGTSAMKAKAEPAQMVMGEPAIEPGADEVIDGLEQTSVKDVSATVLVAAPTKDGKVPIRTNPLTVGALQILGQPLWQPPSPAGFDENLSTWITASQLTQRIAWARRLVGRINDQRDPRVVLEQTLADAARDDTIQVVQRAPSKDAGFALILASPEFNRR